MQTWSSAASRPDTTFGDWADKLARAFVRLEPTPLSQPFRGRIRQIAANDLKVSEVTASAHRVERLQTHIARSTEDTCFVNLQLSGVGMTRQGSLDCITRPMELAVVSTTEPFSITHEDAFSLYSITVDRKRLPETLLREQTLSLAGSPMGREIWKLLLATARRSLSADGALKGTGATLMPHLAGLVHLAVDLQTGQPVETVARSVRVDMVLDFIANNLSREGLGAAMIARAFGISTRYLHRIIEPTGASVSEHINARRLAACADALRQDQPGKISTIAYAHGYRDLSYFNRRFRQTYGETPGQYRARHMDRLARSDPHRRSQ